MKTLCVVAGKSGGHIIPGIVYARNYKKLYSNAHIVFFSTDTALDKSIIALYPYDFSYVPLSLMAVPGKKVWYFPFFLFQFMRAFFTSVKYLRKMRAERVLSMGGYISLPVCLAAFMLRIPIDLFELNAVPGKAIMWLAPIATKIYVCFEEALHYFKGKTVELTDYPLRFSLDDKIPASEAKLQLGLDQAKRTLVILGGSQGSRWLNRFIRTVFESHPELSKNIQVIHQTGPADTESLKEFYRQRGVQALVFDFTHELNYCYAAADLVISRAGAGTIFELDFFEKKSILIPLETDSTAHQVDNALAIAKNKKDQFFVMRQSDLDKEPHKNIQRIIDLLES